MRLLRQHFKIILSALGVLAGAILGAVVQNIVNSGIRLLDAIVTVLSLGIIGVLLAQTSYADTRRRADEKLIEGNETLLLEAKRFDDQQELRLDAATAAFQQSITSLANQFGIRIERQLLEDVNAMTSLEQDPSAQLIYTARQELCILDMISDEGRWPDEAMNPEHADKYFAGIVQLIRDSSPAVEYKRIIQVGDPGISLSKAKGPINLKHCRAMLDLRRERGRRVSLRVARRRFPYKFMLVDRSKLVLQLQEYSVSGGFRIWGELLITDPQGKLVSIFKELWAQIDDDPETRTVTESDLPPRD